MAKVYRTDTGGFLFHLQGVTVPFLLQVRFDALAQFSQAIRMN
jgi:hypothetical protein